MAAALVWIMPAFAQATEDRCAQVTRERTVSCALLGSLQLAAERASIGAAEARRVAVRPLLPTNPVLSVSFGQRPATRTEPEALAWSFSLAQELEVAGQRGLRRRERDAEVAAALARGEAAAREVAAAALVAYFEVLAAEDAVRLAGRLEELTRAAAAAARGRAAKGLLSRVEAEVVEASAVRAQKARLAAEQARRQAGVELAARLGRDPASEPVTAEGSLDPLPVPPGPTAALVLQATDGSPRIRAMRGEVRAQEARVAVLRRERAPNPTLSAFAQTDGVDGRIFGLGLSVPIPLPQPVGRTNAGEIAEAEALVRRAQAQLAWQTQQVRAHLLSAVSSLEQHRAAVQAVTPERLRGAEQALGDIASEIQAGRLAIRDALVLQQGLIELLSSHLESRRALCLASVELQRLAGLLLDGAMP